MGSWKRGGESFLRSVLLLPGLRGEALINNKMRIVFDTLKNYAIHF